jgi:hypothetical protein
MDGTSVWTRHRKGFYWQRATETSGLSRFERLGAQTLGKDVKRRYE